MNNQVKVKIIFAIIGCMVVYAPTQGAVPATMNYQGLLTNIDDTPVEDGSHLITFSIYDADVGGNLMWTESQSVTTSGGFFSTQLGSVNPLADSVFDISYLYLGITVDPDPEILPRTKLDTSPFSFVTKRVKGDIETAPGIIKLDDYQPAPTPPINVPAGPYIQVTDDVFGLLFSTITGSGKLRTSCFGCGTGDSEKLAEMVPDGMYFIDGPDTASIKHNAGSLDLAPAPQSEGLTFAGFVSFSNDKVMAVKGGSQVLTEDPETFDSTYLSVQGTRVVSHTGNITELNSDGLVIMTNSGADTAAIIGPNGFHIENVDGDLTVGGDVIVNGGGVELNNSGHTAALDLGTDGSLSLTWGGTGGTLTFDGPSSSWTGTTSFGDVVVTGSQVSVVDPISSGSLTLTGTDLVLDNGSSDAVTIRDDIGGGTVLLAGSAGGRSVSLSGDAVSLSGGSDISLADAGSISLSGGGGISLADAGSISLTGGSDISLADAGSISFSGGGGISLADAGSVSLSGGGIISLADEGGISLTGGGEVTVSLGDSTSRFNSIGLTATNPVSGNETRVREDGVQISGVGNRLGALTADDMKLIQNARGAIITSDDALLFDDVSLDSARFSRTDGLTLVLGASGTAAVYNADGIQLTGPTARQFAANPTSISLTRPSSNPAMICDLDAADLMAYDLDDDATTDIRLTADPTPRLALSPGTLLRCEGGAELSSCDVTGTATYTGDVTVSGTGSLTCDGPASLSSCDVSGSANFGSPVEIGGPSGIPPGSFLHVNGNITATGAKLFVEDHPTDNSKEIAYVALEGPEAGTYVRGSAQLKGGVAEIELPNHFAMVSSAEGLTAQITPRSRVLSMLFVEKVTPSRLVVRASNAQDSEVRFDYMINGIRKGYENHQVIRSKNEFAGK